MAGEAKITAVTSNGKFATATITLLDTKVEMTAEQTELPASYLSTTNITIMVRDSNGKLVKGETVSLKIPGIPSAPKVQIQKNVQHI